MDRQPGIVGALRRVDVQGYRPVGILRLEMEYLRDKQAGSGFVQPSSDEDDALLQQA